MKIQALVIVVLLQVVNAQPSDVRAGNSISKNVIIKRLLSLGKSESKAEFRLIHYFLRDLLNIVGYARIVNVFSNFIPTVDVDHDGKMSLNELKDFIRKIKESCTANSPESYIFPALTELIIYDGPSSYMFDTNDDILYEVDANKDERYSADEIKTAEKRIQESKHFSQERKKHFAYVFWLLFGSFASPLKREFSTQKCLNIFSNKVNSPVGEPGKPPGEEMEDSLILDDENVNILQENVNNDNDGNTDDVNEADAQRPDNEKVIKIKGANGITIRILVGRGKKSRNGHKYPFRQRSSLSSN